MFRMFLGVLLLTVSIGGILVRWKPAMRIADRNIHMQILLYSSLPESDRKLRQELEFFSCDQNNCVTRAIKTIFESEFHRYSGKNTTFHIVASPPRNTELINIEPQPSAWEGLFLVRHLWKQFQKRKLSYWKSDIRFFINIVPKALTDKTESSIGSSQGRLGFVEWRVGQTHNSYMWNITKIAHELGHTLGASDKYQGTGSSMYPQGYVEPEKGLGNAQKYVEIMSGTRPVGANREEAEATKVEDLRFGEFSAIEMGWK